MGRSFAKILKLLSFLNEEERLSILHEVLASLNEKSEPVQKELYKKVEQWFIDLTVDSNSPFYRSRKRNFIIFILLRYGGLNLEEIFNLKAEDINLQEGEITIRGKHARIIPLPSSINQILIDTWQELVWTAPTPNILNCDPSLLRKTFRKCSQLLNLPSQFFHVSNFRRNRMHELTLNGAHPALIHWFFSGNKSNSVHNIFNHNKTFNEPLPILKILIQNKGVKMNTSARNSFTGKIEFIEKPGLLVEVGVTTENGLKITSIITETSKNNLNLTVGKSVEAIVKAPQVQIFPLDMAGKTPKDLNNCFQGFITDIKTDGKVVEILATLEKGDKICAVYPDKNLLSPEVKVNSQALVAFSAYAVILMD